MQVTGEEIAISCDFAMGSAHHVAPDQVHRDITNTASQRVQDAALADDAGVPVVGWKQHPLHPSQAARAIHDNLLTEPACADRSFCAIIIDGGVQRQQRRTLPGRAGSILEQVGGDAQERDPDLEIHLHVKHIAIAAKLHPVRPDPVALAPDAEAHFRSVGGQRIETVKGPVQRDGTPRSNRRPDSQGKRGHNSDTCRGNHVADQDQWRSAVSVHVVLATRRSAHRIITSPAINARPARAREKMTYILIIILAIACLFLVGPRSRAHGQLTYRTGALKDDPDAVLAAREAIVPDIRPGLHKQIVWRDPVARDRRPWAVVNVHGFSASKEELRPLPDLIASGLAANLFLTRLAGHGRSARAMAEPTADDWLDDMAEALEVGQLLGERVLVIGMSTGATMAAWAALRADMRDSMDALVFISPNFEVRGGATRYMTMPWARQLLRLFVGPVNPVRAQNADFGGAWSVGYPAEAWLPMAAAVRFLQRLSMAEACHPALFIHSPKDTVISVPHVKAAYGNWGGAPKALIEVTDAGDPMQHIIAGRIVSPTPTERLSRQVIDWVRALPAN